MNGPWPDTDKDTVLDKVRLSASGRDVRLSAEAFSEDGRRDALAQVETVPGVRLVDDNTGLVAEVKPYIWLIERDVVRVTLYGNTPLPASRAKLMDAARKTGAGYLLSTALIGQDRETVVYQDPMWGAGYVYRGWYGRYWGPVYTDVRTYTFYTAQTSLTAVASDSIEWTARTRTSDPSNV